MRQTHCIVIAGAPGTGKTTLALNHVVEYPKKALIITSNSYDPKYKRFVKIGVQHISKFRNTNNKVILEATDFTSLFSLIRDNVRNALLVLDDSRFFVDARLQRELEQILINRRHYNLDIIIICHSLNKVPISIWPYATGIVLFYTTDSPDNIRKEVPNRADVIKLITRLKTEAKKDFHHSRALALIENY